MPHLEEGTFHALLDDELTSTELQEARAHLQACDECRGRLEEAQRLLFEADDLVAALEVPAGPSSAPVSRRAPAIKLYPYIAWAATVMLAVGIGYTVGERSGSSIPLADSFETTRAAPTIAEAPANADGAAAGQLDDRAPVEPAEPAKEEQPARKLAASERLQRSDMEGKSTQAVRGQVRDIGGAPIANAQVLVLGTELHAVTDAQGRYEIKGPLPDTVTLRAASIGRQPVEVKELALQSGLMAKQDFTLEPSTPAFEGAAVAAAPTSVPRDEITSKQRAEGELNKNLSMDRTDSASAAPRGLVAQQPAARAGRTDEAVTYVDGVVAVPGYRGELSALRAGKDAAEVPGITDQVTRQGEARRRVAQPQGAAQSGREQAPRQYQDSAPQAREARRIGLDEAARRLSGVIRLLDGMSPNHVALLPAGTVPGALSELEVVRLVYREENGRELLLDQQRVLTPGDTTGARDKVTPSQETDLAPGDTLLVTRPNGVATVRWLDGKGLRLSLSGRVPLDSLRMLILRVR